jgi:transcription antitermination factor NusG
MVNSGLPLSPWPFMRLGQRVRICHGSMQGVEGVLSREKSAYRVVVNVELLNRAVAVEIERDMVCPVTDSAVKRLR